MLAVYVHFRADVCYETYSLIRSLKLQDLLFIEPYVNTLRWSIV